MARRRNSSDDDISLFPFLSIIASVIGVLTMMIATLALAQTDTPDVAQIEEFEQKTKELRETDEAIENLRREISVSNSSALQLREQKQLLSMTVTQLEELLAELEQVEKELAEQKAVEIVIPPVDQSLRETAADMQSQADALRSEVAQLEKDLAERIDASEANVTVLPQGSGLDFIPHFVECAADSIVLHSINPTKRIRRADVAKDEDFIALMEKVVNGTRDSIVFLVRSDALGTYRACKSLCDERDVRNGKIPIVGQGRIDLSQFATDEPRE
ncbi:vacuolar-type H+-ATPase subunit I/STV1 [Rhodopirellula rubra]|uniref:Vacuolar-type H+-ATPase subunit I/STV1 n=2 Tax=Aporhodopirellula rubra TaxID=980271 RepID=A0A7W5H3J8_9BACT|nr:vacuolar-type H+-ATPase subunit I/STV1 [Aporhodopirellula rubra]